MYTYYLCMIATNLFAKYSWICITCIIHSCSRKINVMGFDYPYGASKPHYGDNKLGYVSPVSLGYVSRVLYIVVHVKSIDLLSPIQLASTATKYILPNEVLLFKPCNAKILMLVSILYLIRILLYSWALGSHSRSRHPFTDKGSM